MTQRPLNHVLRLSGPKATIRQDIPDAERSPPRSQGQRPELSLGQAKVFMTYLSHTWKVLKDWPLLHTEEN